MPFALTRRHVLIALLATTLPLASCANNGTAKPLPFEPAVLLARAQCDNPKQEVSARLIEDSAALSATYQQLYRQQLGSAVIPPEIDFSTHVVLLIEMGEQPTAGYALLPAESPAQQIGDTVHIPLLWRAPAPETMVAQVITSPCLLLEIPRGDYARIEILDQENKVRVALSVPR